MHALYCVICYDIATYLYLCQIRHEDGVLNYTLVSGRQATQKTALKLINHSVACDLIFHQLQSLLVLLLTQTNAATKRKHKLS